MHYIQHRSDHHAITDTALYNRSTSAHAWSAVTPILRMRDVQLLPTPITPFCWDENTYKPNQSLLTIEVCVLWSQFLKMSERPGTVTKERPKFTEMNDLISQRVSTKYLRLFTWHGGPLAVGVSVQKDYMVWNVWLTLPLTVIIKHELSKQNRFYHHTKICYMATIL